MDVVKEKNKKGTRTIKGTLKPKYRYLGQTIEIDLPEESGAEGYSVKCMFKYDKVEEKYILSMWLHYKGIDDDFKIDSQEIDTQYVHGTKGTIIENIYRIVQEASLSGFFVPYIERFEYTYDCFEKGDEVYEKERVSKDNNDSK